MRTSITSTEFSWPEGSADGDEIEQVARVADAAGIDTVFVSDHLLQMVPGTFAKRE